MIPEPLEQRILRESDLEQLAGLLAPLSNPSRLKLLRFLTTPHYLEEVASHLMLTRQAARKHLDRLLEIGVIEKRPGVRESGPVTDYVVNPQALFVIHDAFEKLGSLKPRTEPDYMVRTLMEPGLDRTRAVASGPALFIVRGMDSGYRFRLDAPGPVEWTIGRDLRCQIVIGHDPWVSNRHAEVHRDGKRYVLTDLRSTNATLHNWSLLPRGSQIELKHGDVIGIGKTLLLFWDRTRV